MINVVYGFLYLALKAPLNIYDHHFDNGPDHSDNLQRVLPSSPELEYLPVNIHPQQCRCVRPMENP